jgi:hypothetical protein
MGKYRTAEICLNGHVTTDSADNCPELREKFCSKCGEKTITACPDCNTNIRGHYYVAGIVTLGEEFKPPLFCYNCGSAFPWTVTLMEEAVECVDSTNSLTNDELERFRKDLCEIVKDSPKVQASSLRIKSTLQKIGTVGANCVKEIIVQIASETAKKIIWSI